MRSQAKLYNLDYSISVPNILLVASGKGGVGKTWFSITYAHALAKKGKKVLLFDGDLGMANVDVQLGIVIENDLGHFLSGDCLIEDAITHYDKGGFDILAGRSGCGSLGSMPFSRMENLQVGLTHLAGKYHQVIIDLGAGIGGTVRQLAQLAGKCIVITTDEPTSMTDAYAVIKYMRSFLPNLDVWVVVNQVSTPHDGQRIFETLKSVCQNFLKYTPNLAGIIPRNSHVPDSIRNQQPIFIRHPHTDPAAQVEKIADLMGR